MFTDNYSQKKSKNMMITFIPKNLENGLTKEKLENAFKTYIKVCNPAYKGLF